MGINGHFDSDWTPCKRNDLYTITFYADSSGTIGAVESTEISIIPKVEDTGLEYDGFPLYHYSWNLETPVDLAAGWVSIQGVSDTSCRFRWISSGGGGQEVVF